MVYPAHLVSGILLEKTGVCAELSFKYPKLLDLVNERVKRIYPNRYELGIGYEPFTINISLSTEEVLLNACNRMKHFKQVYLNEGHLADALFRSNDDSTSAILDGLDISGILGIVSSPRDMIVSLKDYEFPIISTSNIHCRKAKQKDATWLKSFVENEFGNRWIAAVENGLSQENIPIFITIENNQINGFACFDVGRNKKGLFGPMGTSLSNRVQGIGYTLLHHCLREMKEKDYEYAIIGQVGPLEFYEQACNAVIIPMNEELNI